MELLQQSPMIPIAKLLVAIFSCFLLWAFAAYLVAVRHDKCHRILKLSVVSISILASVLTFAYARTVIKRVVAIRSVYASGGCVFYEDDPSKGHRSMPAQGSHFRGVKMVSLGIGVVDRLAAQHLANIPELSEVMISGHVDAWRFSELMDVLGKHTGLDSASFHLSNLDNRKLIEVSKLPLTSVLFSSDSFSDLDLGLLKQNQHLESLFLMGHDDQNPEVFEQSNIEAICSFPKLRRLCIIRLDLSSERLVEKLTTLDHLESLKLTSTKISPEQVERLVSELPKVAVEVYPAP